MSVRVQGWDRDWSIEGSVIFTLEDIGVPVRAPADDDIHIAVVVEIRGGQGIVVRRQAGGAADLCPGELARAVALVDPYVVVA